MLVPGGVGRAVAVGHLNESHARLAEPAGHQALAAEVVGVRVADAVERLGFRRFARKVEHVRARGSASARPARMTRRPPRARYRRGSF